MIQPGHLSPLQKDFAISIFLPIPSLPNAMVNALYSTPKETLMHDFPLWLKLIIWLSVGSVVVYTAANILINAF
jgi:hypothetical protein